MKFFRFLFHFIAILMLVQLAVASDEIVEDVDEDTPPENLEGVPLRILKAKVLQNIVIE